jgi:hypothetical protein
MKAKLKSANKITGFLLAHGEKLGIVAVLVVAGLLIKASLGRERLPEEKFPPQLQSQAADAQRHYEEMTWDKFPPEERVDVVALKSVPDGGVAKPVDEEKWPILPESFNPPIVPPVGLRTDPDLLAPVNLEVNAASGLWAYGDPEVIRQRALEAAERAQKEAKEEEERRREEEEDMDRGRGGRGEGRGFGGEGGFRGGYGGMSGIEMTEDGAAVIRPNMAAAPGLPVRNESWVAVLAKVPIKGQVEKYRDALAKASGYNDQYDMPQYIGYVVERAEITEEGQQKWVALPSVLKRTIIDAMESRPIEPPELANPKYTHPLLTWPLPPMVLRPWGDEVTHSDLPIPTPEDMYEEQMEAAEAAEQKPKEGEEEGDEFAAQQRRERDAAAPAMGGGEFGRGAYGDQGMYGRPPMGGFGGEMGRGMGGYGGEFGGGFGGEMGRGYGGYGEMAMGRGSGAYENLPEKPWDMKTKYYLFRYYDNTVEPGRRYRYRVKLALADVNSDSPERRIAERYLDPTVNTRKAEGPKDRTGKPVRYRFTEWSEPSPVAAVPQPGLIYMAQVKPSANATTEPQALVLVKSLDAEAVAEVGLADWFSRGSVVNRMGEQAQIIWSPTFQVEDRDGERRPSPEFDFVTGVTLLDFTGGEVLNRNRELLAPARALVMDATGRMSVEEELADEMPVREYKVIVETIAEERRNRQDDDRGGDERRGRGRGRGRR